jgi:hypothetical protein
MLALTGSIFSGQLLASSESLIDQDAQSGSISRDEAIILKAIAIVQPQSLPVRYRSAQLTIEKCATENLRDALEVIQANPALYKSYAEILRSRPPAEFSIDSPQGFFRLHYDTSGTNAVRSGDENSNLVPDYIERAAQIADSVWLYEVLNLGYLCPPSDGTQGGGAGLYDIYFQLMGPYGYTSPETPGPNPWNDYTSHIVVHSTFAGFPPNEDPEGDVIGALKVTIAHEFFHAVQFAYNVGAASYFMEQSSTWMEDMAYPEVNDNYSYLPYFFSAPQTGLQSGGNHAYAAFVWPKFLQENLGVGIIRDMWWECRFNSVVGAWSYVLDTLGTTLDAQFARFVIWNYHTGDRNNGKSYQSASDYPQIHIMRYSETIPDSNEVSSEPPEPLASNYIVINNYSGYRGVLTVSFAGLVAATWSLSYVIDYGSSVYVDSLHHTLENGIGKIYIPRLEDVLRVIIIPGVASSYGTNFNYTYHAYLRPSGDADGNEIVNISDATYGVNYIFGSGPAPDPPQAMDADCNGYENISDVIYVISYIFGGGPAPCR